VLLTQLSCVTPCCHLPPREHLRALLQAEDDDDWEVAEVDLSDDESALFVEEFAANMNDTDVEELCDVVSQPEVQALVQSYINPDSGPVRGYPGLSVLQHSAPRLA
jgi:hypothetical protein